MYIQDIYRFINTLKSQGQGRGISAKEYEDYFNQASLSLWRREIKNFEKTLAVSNYLKNFEHESNVTDFDTEISDTIGHFDSFEIVKYIDNEAVDKEIDFIRTPDVLDNKYFSRRNTDTVYPPTEDYPILKLVGNKVVVSPDTFHGYIVTGIKYPTPIVYATTTSVDGRDYVFDEAGSTDTDWPIIAHGELISIICKPLGITLKDDWLAQYESLQKQSEIAA